MRIEMLYITGLLLPENIILAFQMYKGAALPFIIFYNFTVIVLCDGVTLRLF